MTGLELVAMVGTGAGSFVLGLLGERRRSGNGNGHAKPALPTETSHVLAELNRTVTRHIGEDERWQGGVDKTLEGIGRELGEIKGAIEKLDGEVALSLGKLDDRLRVQETGGGRRN